MRGVSAVGPLVMGQLLICAVLAAVVAVMAGGCSGGTSPVPHAPVTSAQRAAIAHYYRAQLWPSDFLDDNPRVGCPVDVLGATRRSDRLRVYTVIHCTSAAANCVGGTNATFGLVAVLEGTQVVSTQEDNTITMTGASGAIAEATIYPPSLRSTALNDINYGGPAWLANRAVKELGCPHGLRA